MTKNETLKKSNTKFITNHTDSLSFEHLLRLVVGKSKYQSASLANQEIFVVKELIGLIKILRKDTCTMDTTSKHRELLISQFDILEKQLKRKENVWEIIFTLFYIISKLYGYLYVDCSKIFTPVYWQTKTQYFHENIIQGIRWEEIYKNEQNVISKKIEIIKKLKREGLSSYQISLVLNVSEYEIKKICREISA